MTAEKLEGVARHGGRGGGGGGGGLLPSTAVTAAAAAAAAASCSFCEISKNGSERRGLAEEGGKCG